MNHKFDKSSSNIFHWAIEIVDTYFHSIVFSPHNNIVEFDGVCYKTNQLQKLLTIVRQCLPSQQYLLLERDYQSHTFHGAFLKRPQVHLIWLFHLCGYVIVALPVIMNP